MRIYLAGPMSGVPEHNFPAFRSAGDELRTLGYDVVSPVEMDEAEGFDAATAPDVAPGSQEWNRFLARDVMVVADPATEAVVVLPGWERSRGACLEVHVARALGKVVLAYPDLEPIPEPGEERPLEEALRLVHGNRGEDYGHPAEDFARTAGAWRALFGWDATPERVALAMVCVKLSRLVQTPAKRDSVTDIAGYAEAYWMVIERLMERPA